MTPNDSLQVSASGDREIHITRTFDAPRAHIWEAMTRADLLRRWLTGPPGWEATECTSDLRVGGRYRHAWRGPDGVAMAMSGEWLELSPPERLVRTEVFEFGCESQAGGQHSTLTLEELDGGAGTRLRIEVRYPSTEARDAALASGMEQGMAASYAALDGLLADSSA